MNVKLSVCVIRPKGKSGFALYKEGRVLEHKVRRLTSENIKDELLLNLSEGLAKVRGSISHEDLLIIEVQNRHLYEWLSGKVEMKIYSDGLDKALGTLESLDCRYRFIFLDKPTCKNLVELGETESVKGTGALDAFADLEE